MHIGYEYFIIMIQIECRCISIIEFLLVCLCLSLMYELTKQYGWINKWLRSVKSI